MTVEVRVLAPDDAPVLERLVPGVFDKPIDRELSAEFLADRRHHLAVALDGDVVVGFASGVDYIHPDKPAELWVNEVGVAEEYRRAGVGRLLLQALFRLGRELGCREAWVLTEQDNDAARRLYEATDGQSESVVFYSFKIQEELEASQESNQPNPSQLPPK